MAKWKSFSSFLLVTIFWFAATVIIFSWCAKRKRLTSTGIIHARAVTYLADLMICQVY